MLTSVKELRTLSGDQVSRKDRLHSGTDIEKCLSDNEKTDESMQHHRGKVCEIS